MAKYKSKYPQLGFYVDEQLKQFANGEYETNDKAEQAVLDVLVDVEKVDEPAPAKKTPAKQAAVKE